MTIKEFASLCGCSTQTLRYYDKIDLLKPVKVDQWSGYRYYEKGQALDFVKIKNLQAADFSIDEIKRLLSMPDQQVFEAFEKKIVEQTRKLERIKEIQHTYLTEKSNMEKLIQNMTDYLLHAISDFELLREFGMEPEDGPAVVEKLKDFIGQSTKRHLPKEPDVQMRINDQVIHGVDRVADAFVALKENNSYDDTVLLMDGAQTEADEITEENSELCWECHGWSYVYEFLKMIPAMERGFEYCFFFQLTNEKYSDGLEFPMFMIATMLPRVEDGEIIAGCSIKKTEDGKNHFALRRRAIH